jgi:hypothetical protein
VAEVLAGEAEHYVVVLSAAPSALPAGTGALIDARTVSCPDAVSQRNLLQWALSQGLTVESVSRNRHSLEDVLAREVAKRA